MDIDKMTQSQALLALEQAWKGGNTMKGPARRGGNRKGRPAAYPPGVLTSATTLVLSDEHIATAMRFGGGSMAAGVRAALQRIAPLLHYCGPGPGTVLTENRASVLADAERAQGTLARLVAEVGEELKRQPPTVEARHLPRPRQGRVVDTQFERRLRQAQEAEARIAGESARLGRKSATADMDWDDVSTPPR